MFLNGERAWARSGATFDAIDPAKAEAFANVALGDKADIDPAVASAQAAMAAWAGLPPVRRVRVLNRLASLLRERTREFAQLESLDVGKPLRQAEDDVGAAAGYFEFFAGVADKVFGSSIPLGAGFVDFTLREPLGVSAQIIPWNYPLRLAHNHADAERGANLYGADPAAGRGGGARPLRRAARATDWEHPPGSRPRQPGHGPGRERPADAAGARVHRRGGEGWGDRVDRWPPLGRPPARAGLLHRADLARPGDARDRPGTGGDFRSGADPDHVPVDRRGDRDRQRHALWAGDRDLDARPEQGAHRGDGSQVRAGAC